MSNSKTVAWGSHWRSSDSFAIWTCAVAVAADFFLYSLLLPIFPFLLQDRLGFEDDNAIQTATSRLLAIYSAASVATAIPAGILGDGAQFIETIFLLGSIPLFASTVIYPVAFSMPALLASRALAGINSSITTVLCFAIMARRFPNDKFSGAMGLIMSLYGIAAISGPVLGGVLYRKTGDKGVFILSLVVTVIDASMRLLFTGQRSHDVDSDDVVSDGLETSEDVPKSTSVENSDAGASERGSLLSTAPPNRSTPDYSSIVKPPNKQVYQIPESGNVVTKKFPILHCMSNPRLIFALILAGTQSSYVGQASATVPIEAYNAFRFDSSQTGLLFIIMGVPLLVMSWWTGKFVDHYGARRTAVLGYGCTALAMILLSVHCMPWLRNLRTGAIVSYCIALVFTGVGLTFITFPGQKTSSRIVGKYIRANPGRFGKHGPYAQLFGLSLIFDHGGFTLGPLVAGALRNAVGYGSMVLCFGALAVAMVVLSCFMVQSPRSEREEEQDAADLQS